jgi:hypothetical protein
VSELMRTRRKKLVRLVQLMLVRGQRDGRIASSRHRFRIVRFDDHTIDRSRETTPL